MKRGCHEHRPCPLLVRAWLDWMVKGADKKRLLFNSTLSCVVYKGL